MAEKNDLMEKLVSLAKRRGFIYPGSEIYGGLANTYDYGPLGTELLRNIKNLWWKFFVQERSDMVGLDASIISHHKIWQASGHVAGFADAMIDCKNCKARMRADHLLENYLETMDDGARTSLIQSYKDDKEVMTSLASSKVEGFSIEALEKVLNLLSNVNSRHSGDDSERSVEEDSRISHERPALPAGRDSGQARMTNVKPLRCPNCGKHDWTAIRKFNQLFPVQLGIVEGSEGMGYLRGETAQGIFINFRNVVDSSRVRLPFGIAQLGKSFRNEITPGNSVFRTIEFEQGEIEYFFDPESSNWEELFEKWKSTMWDFVTKELEILENNLRWRSHTDEERSFYSTRTEDLEYNFPFGFKELWGLAYRTNYDLTKHSEASKKDLTITDPYTQKKILPHVIEPAVGINRLLLMVLLDAYTEEGTSAGGSEGKRTVLKINPKIAPYKVAIFPLLANKEPIVEKAREVYNELKKHFMVTLDARGNIGKRYMAQDEIGTPWCVTVDFDSLEDESVTVRDRDTMKQERVTIAELVTYFTNKLS